MVYLCIVLGDMIVEEVVASDEVCLDEGSGEEPDSALTNWRRIYQYIDCSFLSFFFVEINTHLIAEGPAYLRSSATNAAEERAPSGFRPECRSAEMYPAAHH